jgi:hypothetical protein
MRGVNLSATLTVLALVVAVGPAAEATQPVALETHVLLRIEALTVPEGASKSAAAAPETELGPNRPQAIDLVVPWGPDRVALGVHLSACMTSLTPDGEAVLQLESSVVRKDQPPVAASREMRLSDGGSGLFEVFAEGERRLILTLHAEQVPRAVVRPLAEVGAPVTFNVAVLRVDGERVVPLETNELHTFVGQAVEYSFRRGEGDGLETVRLNLLPIAVTGELVTIDAEIEGALPGASGPILVSHSARIVASRKAGSALSATAGTPPAGYRFQVTPDF